MSDPRPLRVFTPPNTLVLTAFTCTHRGTCLAHQRWRANGHRLWAAAARALRTPSLIDLGFHVEYPAALAIPALPLRREISRQENLLRADTPDTEVSGRVQIRGGWHLDGALATFHLTPHPMSSLDPLLTDYDGHTPAYQWRAHAAMPLSRRGQADSHVFRTGPIDSADVPAIARLDVRAEWMERSGGLRLSVAILTWASRC